MKIFSGASVLAALMVTSGSLIHNPIHLMAAEQMPGSVAEGGSLTAVPVQWKEEDGGNGNWYAVLADELFWFEADAAAETQVHEGMTGRLATITSAGENSFIINQVIGTQAQPSILDLYWLGGREAGGSWAWQTGEALTFTHWLPGEPNNPGIETALCMWGPFSGPSGGDPGRWNDALPDDHVNSLHRWWSVIEWGDLDSLGTTLPTDTLVNLIQWEESAGGNGHWYAVLTGEKYWIDAKAASDTLLHNGEVGYLATVTTADENEFILNSVIAGTHQTSILDMFWLGGRDINGWHWINNEPYVYTNWSTGEPNNNGIETALGMWGHNQNDERRIPGKWNDALPDPVVNPYSQFWTLIEWGEPDTTLPPAVCGNGIIEPGEECDDGNLIAGDGCDPWCALEDPPEPVCGNGIVELGEQCDDGNLIAGDGCDPWCFTEDDPPGDDELLNLTRWEETDGGNGHWYAVLTGEKYWVDADAATDTLVQGGMTGYLATVTSPAENSFVLNQVIVGTNQPSILDMFWFGGRDSHGWYWITNEPFIYTNWSTGEPNNQGIETAMGMWGHNQNDPRRIPGKWNNALPDASVNPHSRFWSVVEWGEPDSTIPPPICGNGILEHGEECDDGNLVAGDGCDPWCLFEDGGAAISLVVDTDSGHGTLYAGVEGSIVFSVIAPSTQDIAAFSMPLEYLFSNGNIIGPVSQSGSGARVEFSEKAQSACEALVWNNEYGDDATDPDTTVLACIDFGGPAWHGSGEIWRLIFIPLDTGTIIIDGATISTGALLELVDGNAQDLPFEWAPTEIRVVEGIPTGNVNGVGSISSSDVIYLVNYMFKAGPSPVFCEARGDVDCSGTVTTSDLISLVNFIFKNGVRPCNAGPLEDVGIWVCP